MGDCRLHIQISRDLLGTESSQNSEESKKRIFHSITKLWSSDTTVREVLEGSDDVGVPTLISLLENKQACLWDCTVHPSKDISDWPIEKYKDKKGAHSKTLFDAGWYPSGSLQLLPSGQAPLVNQSALQEDAQYNISHKLQSQKHQQLPVQLLNQRNGGLPMPSQVLHSVTQRFKEEEKAATKAEIARQVRRKNQQMASQKEKERFRKLEQRIQMLEESSSKNKKVSEQVRRMLIKSRATGRSDLKMQDRIYLVCIIDNGESIREEFRYFSPQDTIGKMLGSFAKGKDRNIEFLVRDGRSSDYHRLGTLTRLYEAISQKYVSEFDKVVIRLYDPKTDDATMSAEDRVAPDQATAMQTEKAEEDGMTSTAAVDPMEVVAEPTIAGNLLVINQRLSDAIRAWEEKKEPKKKKPKVSVTSTKVRQMQMKSRAKGDAKRIKLEDRFFLELFCLEDDEKTEKCSVTDVNPIFIGRSDTFDRLVRDCVKLRAASWSWELMVPTVLDDNSDSPRFRQIIDTSITLEDAEKKKIIDCFGRIILRFFPS